MCLFHVDQSESLPFTKRVEQFRMMCETIGFWNFTPKIWVISHDYNVRNMGQSISCKKTQNTQYYVDSCYLRTVKYFQRTIFEYRYTLLSVVGKYCTDHWSLKPIVEQELYPGELRVCVIHGFIKFCSLIEYLETSPPLFSSADDIFEVSQLNWLGHSPLDRVIISVTLSSKTNKNRSTVDCWMKMMAYSTSWNRRLVWCLW